jgi:hypothetical protein
MRKALQTGSVAYRFLSSSSSTVNAYTTHSVQKSNGVQQIGKAVHGTNEESVANRKRCLPVSFLLFEHSQCIHNMTCTREQCRATNEEIMTNRKRGTNEESVANRKRCLPVSVFF